MLRTIERVTDIADLPPLEYAVLIARVVLGLMNVAHALMSLALGSPAWWAYALIAGELAGGAMLLAGLYLRQVAIGMLPLLLGAAVTHLASGIGVSLGFAIYFLVSFAGQALLAGWAGTGAPLDDESPIILQTK